jgi:type IV pilus assembly protein PilM
MASSGAVWGIDIGQCALKALRCRRHDQDPKRLVADGFDYIEYPKILGQPDADPAELIGEALKTFLSRNNLREDTVALAVAGQNGLARFIKLPPVEAKKIPDIVRYEAKQQIPFKLEDVVWDYQTMPGTAEEEGFALESEVGLFAMKRDQVFRALRPLEEAGVEVDVIQLTPLAIYNYVAFDLLGTSRDDAYDPDKPPAWTVILSVGTDASDLVATNGYRVWLRNIPIGGNHFTKALTKQLKLTFSKAEHLKRNSGAANPEDAKALFKAMRPVFGDLLNEVQNSIRYFQRNVDKNATIARFVPLGNAMKLPGLKRYLAQSLELELLSVDALRRMGGPAVLGAPAFKENLLSYGVSYGLCIQALGQGMLSTNLLPQEIHTERLIEEKKPWALAAAAVLLLGLTVNYCGHLWSWYTSRFDGHEPYRTAQQFNEGLLQTKQNYADAYQEKKGFYRQVDAMGDRLVRSVEGKLLWPELIKAIVASLPQNQTNMPDEPDPDVSSRGDLFIEKIDALWFDDLSEWFTDPVKRRYIETNPEVKPSDIGLATTSPTDATAEESDEPPDDPYDASPGAQGGPATVAKPAKRGGWVVEIRGRHYHNTDPADAGPKYVQRTLIDRLKNHEVEILDASGNLRTTKIADLGVRYPVLIQTGDIVMENNPVLVIKEASGNFDPETDGKLPKQVKRFDFVLQFWWEETLLSQRVWSQGTERRGSSTVAARE